MTRAVKVAAAALALLTSAPIAQSRGADPYAGMRPRSPVLDSILAVSSHLSRQPEYSREREFELSMLGAAGVHFLRNDFPWSELEPRPGEWTPQGMDAMSDLVIASGMEPIAILGGAPSWAMPHGSDNEIGLAAFAEYASYVASHFRGRVRYYEVWNEEDQVRFWRPWPDPDRYGALLEAAAKAVRANDPDAVILFGGMSPTAEHLMGPRGLWRFLRRVHDRHPDVCRWFDALAIHPYTFLQQTEPEAGSSSDAVLWYDLTGAVSHARQELASIGCGDKQIWITEAGWPDTFIGERRQAAYLARSLFLALQADVSCYAWYTFWDGPRHWYTEDGFGLFAWPHDAEQAKPDYAALKAAHELVGTMRYQGDLGAALKWQNGCHALALAGAGDHAAVVIWKQTARPGSVMRVAVPLPPGHTHWELMAQDGRKLDAGQGSEVEVVADLEVTYLLID